MKFGFVAVFRGKNEVGSKFGFLLATNTKLGIALDRCNPRFVLFENNPFAVPLGTFTDNDFFLFERLDCPFRSL